MCVYESMSIQNCIGNIHPFGYLLMYEDDDVDVDVMMYSDEMIYLCQVM